MEEKPPNVPLLSLYNAYDTSVIPYILNADSGQFSVMC